MPFRSPAAMRPEPAGQPWFARAAPRSYPRGGGLVPWRNAVFLFVNVLPGADAPYPNAFLDGGRRITWRAAHRRLPRSLQAFGTQRKALPDKGDPQACSNGVES